MEGRIATWDLATGDLQSHWRETDYQIPYLTPAFSPDGSLFATFGREGIEMWDSTTGETLGTLKIPTYGHFAISPDWTLVVTVYYDEALDLWGIPAE